MGNQVGGGESGTPSKSLKEAMEKGKASGGGIVDQDSNYETVTNPVPEKGVFTLVGGYVDDEGELHNDVELRAMTGHEEDLLGNKSASMLDRMDSILTNCTMRLGTITDKGAMMKAIKNMPSGTKTHLLISQRIAGHWKTEKDIYEMEVRCPSQNSCGKIGYYKINLLDLDVFEPEDPTQLMHTTKLPYCEDEIVWQVMTGAEDRIMQVVADSGVDVKSSAMSFAILVRIREWNGEPVDLAIRDFISGGNKPKLKLSRKAKEYLLKVKNLVSGDRGTLLADFEEKEAGVDLEVDIECQHCNREFIAKLDVGQESFFFPQATSLRSRRRRSI